ncbi:MAG: hypothetical protein ACTSYA_02920, partial [Candidatus Kariarchaeaceae archaeon]
MKAIRIGIRKKREIREECPFCGKKITLNDKLCKNCQRKIVKCQICYRPINPVDEKIVQCRAESSCGAMFHKTHLFKWLRYKKSCPHCKGELRIEMYGEKNRKTNMKIETFSTEEIRRVEPLRVNFLRFCFLTNTRYTDLKEVKHVFSSKSFSLNDKLAISLLAGIIHGLFLISSLVSIFVGISFVSQLFFQNNSAQINYTTILAYCLILLLLGACL